MTTDDDGDSIKIYFLLFNLYSKSIYLYKNIGNENKLINCKKYINE